MDGIDTNSTKIHIIYGIEIQVNKKQTGILQAYTRLHTRRKGNDSKHTNLIQTEEFVHKVSIFELSISWGLGQNNKLPRRLQL